MLFPTLAILTFISMKCHTFYSGKEIELQAVFIRQQEMVTVDRIALSYEISRIDLRTMPNDGIFIVGDVIFATLTKKEKYWTIDRVNHSPSLLTRGQVCMRGKVTSSLGGHLLVERGIESYSFSEDNKADFGKLQNAREFSAKVSVGPDCSCVLKGLVVSGEPIRKPPCFSSHILV
jgi:uncharacterized membrane-anchored protein